jgi:glycosidase/fibronectin type 3 domain-containing protein
MSPLKKFIPHLILLAILSIGFQVASAPDTADAMIVIDGVREADWGDPLASDPAGDMSEPNLDLQGLYVVEDADNYYIGFDATASTWGMTYGIYLDTDQVGGSGATSNPWGGAVSAVSAHLPEHSLSVWHEDWDALQDVELNHWDGVGWSYESLISQGGEQGYGSSEDWIEYRIPKAALGSPDRIALELFTAGGGGHAQDSVPSDPNVAYSDPDWGGDVTTLSVFAIYPPPEWYARGDFNGWNTDDPLFDDGTHGDADPGDGMYTTLVTVETAGRYEFKIATDDWAANYPGSGNSWFDTSVGGEVVTITFDTRALSDGWLPETNIIGVSTEPGAWTAVGDWQGWDNANPMTAMTDLGGGIYQLETTIASPGSYQYKAVKTGTWDAIGADGRSVNAGTIPFDIIEADQGVLCNVDALAGRVNLAVEAIPVIPAHDDNVWWDGLGHNSRDDLYRVPGGAVTTGTPVTLRLRTFHDDVTEVTARLWSTTAEAQTLLPMALVATTDDAPYGYDYWEAVMPAQAEPTILYYRFIVRDGSDEDFYEDDELFDGGWGMSYDDSPDYSYQIDVYQPDFDTPDWMKNAVVYQIFPDRFNNGNPKNDAKTRDPSVYENPVIVKEWEDLPEGYCRAYVGVPCDEEPMGRDFFGGDLEGVKKKLDYLEELGITAIYFNPVFQAPSNHLYDTTDYFRIDPYFGSMGTFQSLINQAGKRGIHVILDGVFNHTSSDSLYFDRYSRYNTLGAYESQESKYYEWYTFYEWPDSYNSWWGFDSLPVLTEIQGVRDLIFGTEERGVARWWVEHNAAGWRLDVAPDKSHDFWREFRGSVKSVDPDAIIIGEIWDDASPWILGDEFDSTMNYRFRRALIGFINGDTNDPNQGYIRGLNPDQFDSILQSIKEDYPAPAFETTMNLVGTHDTQRILWALTPGDRNRAQKEENLANLTEGKDKLKLLAIVQMTLPGAPTIYYGDEIGMTGDTDPDDRRPLPWDDVDTAMLDHYQTLTGLRHEYSFLRTGSFDRLYTYNEDGTYVYGRKDPSGAAIVAVNRDTAPHEVYLDLAGYVPEGTLLVDALNGGSYVVTDGQFTLSLNGRWGAILITEADTDLNPPEPPTGLNATEGDSAVDLEWSASEGAAGYYVYRSPVTGGGYTRLNDIPLPDTAYSDGTAINGRLYYYVVTAVDAAGNESDRSDEASALPHMVIGWANLQWPPDITHTINALVPTENIYGQVWIGGHTNLPGPTEGLTAQVGFGPDGTDPDGNLDWVWTTAAFNVDAGNNDEFMGQLTPEAVGVFDYAYRYSTTAGQTWVYADLDGTGNGYDPAQAGELTVNPSGDTTPPAAPANLRLSEASPSFIRLAWDVVPDGDLYRYEVYRGDASGGPYAKIANVPAATTEYTDWAVSTVMTAYYVVLAADTSFNPSAFSNEVEATAQARPVAVTFNATLPDTTPEGEDIYMGGSFNGWNPAGTLMARSGLAASVTLPFYEGDSIEYKYTRGSWDYVEKGGACEEIANRTLTIVYGTDGTMTVDDTVLNWRNTAPCGD